MISLQGTDRLFYLFKLCTSMLNLRDTDGEARRLQGTTGQLIALTHKFISLQVNAMNTKQQQR
jgi:hypothetical protein